MHKKIWGLLASLYSTKIDESFLKDQYESLPTNKLKGINSRELTSQAFRLWTAEVERRDLTTSHPVKTLVGR